MKTIPEYFIIYKKKGILRWRDPYDIIDGKYLCIKRVSESVSESLYYIEVVNQPPGERKYCREIYRIGYTKRVHIRPTLMPDGVYVLLGLQNGKGFLKRYA